MRPRMQSLHFPLDCNGDDKLRVKGEEPIIAANVDWRELTELSLSMEFFLRRTADSGHMHGL